MTTTANITLKTVNDTCTAVHLNGHTSADGFIYFPNGQLSYCESGFNHSFVKTFQEAIDLIVAWDAEVEEPQEEHTVSYHVNSGWYYSLDTAIEVARVTAQLHNTVWSVKVVNHAEETSFTLYVNGQGQYSRELVRK